MATTDLSSLNADMLRDMMRAINEYRPEPSTFLLSSGNRDALRRAAEPTFKLNNDNPLFAGQLASYHGFSLNVVDIPKEKVFDWSGCRSPARAKRRYAKGHPQRVKVTEREVAYLVDTSVLRRYADYTDRVIMKALIG